MFERLALSQLMDLNKKLESDCGMDVSDYDADYLESLIDDPIEHLEETDEKFQQIMANVNDKTTRIVYYSLYYQGRIDGVLNLFRLKNEIENTDGKHKH